MGECVDCRHRVQEWGIVIGEHTSPGNPRLSVELDRWCQVTQLFVPDRGFCHWFDAE
jgi:hypothetical protein